MTSKISAIDLNTLLKMGADQVLGLKYTQVFPPNMDGINRIFQKLRSIWHPDRNADPKAGEVFSKITNLHRDAEQRISIGVWGDVSVKTFETKSSELQMTYLHLEEEPDLFSQYIGEKYLSYHVPACNSDLSKIWMDNLNKLCQETDAVPAIKEDKHLYYSVPHDYRHYDLIDGSSLLVFRKTEEYVPLNLVIKEHKLRPEDVAWIMTRLMRMCALCDKFSIPNLEISTRSVYINPDYHSVTVFDGWQFGTKLPGVPVAATPKALRMMTDSSNKTFRVNHMMYMVKALGRTLLGDVGGVKLLNDPLLCPKPFAKWLVSPSSSEVAKELSVWDKAKKEAFGPPKFVSLVLDYDKIYP